MYYTKSMKKSEVCIISSILGLGIIVIITLGVIGAVSGVNADCKEQCYTGMLAVDLPKPEVSGGMRGELGIDKNVNEATIDQYLGRGDAVYRDMRMLIDEANYEAIGGDSYLSGYVEGFEVIPYPMLVNVSGLPEAVGQTYSGPTLFTYSDGKYTANYAESMEILEYYFPKGKTIFLMCGGGGYAGMTKEMLVNLGWDGSKIYNVGGYWYYDGENNVPVKRKQGDEVVYDFWKVPYHGIDFTLLHKPSSNQVMNGGSEESDNDGLIDITAEEFRELVQSRQDFTVIAHMTICPAEFPLTTIAKQLAREEKMTIYALSEEEFRKTELAEKIKYLPTAAIYKDGKMVKYLDAEKDEDLKYYQTVEGLKGWIEK